MFHIFVFASTRSEGKVCTRFVYMRTRGLRIVRDQVNIITNYLTNNNFVGRGEKGGELLRGVRLIFRSAIVIAYIYNEYIVFRFSFFFTPPPSSLNNGRTAE